jgi:hypothetical protein
MDTLVDLSVFGSRGAAASQFFSGHSDEHYFTTMGKPTATPPFQVALKQMIPACRDVSALVAYGSQVE